MSRPDPVSGMLAEFDGPGALVEAARRVRAGGYRRLDAFTPFPVDGIAEVLGFRERRLGPICFLGGLAGLSATFALSWALQLDYPINVGGRPLFAVPAFSVVGFEIMVLGAVLTAVAAMLVLNGLPRLHHPVFESDRFRLVSDDRFMLWIAADDPAFERAETAALLTRLGARSVEVLPC